MSNYDRRYIGKTDNDVMVDEIVAAVEERAEVLAAEVAEAAE